MLRAQNIFYSGYDYHHPVDVDKSSFTNSTSKVNNRAENNTDIILVTTDTNVNCITIDTIVISDIYVTHITIMTCITKNIYVTYVITY
ncbi:hypothetical protein GCM10022407_32500 [Hymenobacter antarcticus]|uniref:Uncharacterized protein n=1 Tax=Hymenobacter antarcticus TaxID=486270 RepID=A0ABP7QMJ9_9BACT